MRAEHQWGSMMDKTFIVKGSFEFEVEAETYEDAIEETNDMLNLSNIEFEVDEVEDNADKYQAIKSDNADVFTQKL